MRFSDERLEKELFVKLKPKPTSCTFEPLCTIRLAGYCSVVFAFLNGVMSWRNEDETFMFKRSPQNNDGMGIGWPLPPRFHRLHYAQPVKTKEQGYYAQFMVGR